MKQFRSLREGKLQGSLTVTRFLQPMVIKDVIPGTDFHRLDPPEGRKPNPWLYAAACKINLGYLDSSQALYAVFYQVLWRIM